MAWARAGSAPKGEPRGLAAAPNSGTPPRTKAYGQLEKHRTKVYQQHHLPRAAAFPEVRALFERLRAEGTRVALASSAKEPELEAYKKVANIADLVDEQTTTDDAEKSKPHPDIFLAALQRLAGIAPADVLVVGDTPYDAEAAGKAGLRAVGVLCGGFPEDALRNAGCIAIYRDPADLLAQFDHSPLVRRDSA